MLGLVFWDQQFQYSDYNGNCETDESFEEALRYLDNLNILCHYKDVLPDVIFCDLLLQVLLDNVNTLCHEYTISSCAIHL